MFTKFLCSNNVESFILELKNRFFEFAQGTKTADAVSRSLFFLHIDKFIFAALLLTFASAPFLSTSGIGFFVLLFIALVALKLLVKKGEKFTMTPIDAAVALFFALSILSLMGSTLFWASFHGFLKVMVYIAFYFCLTHYLRENKSKIWTVLALVAVLISFESVVGILQNFGGVLEIAGWQDTSNLEVNEIISRAYGTLKPFNPNLLAGYILPGLAVLFYFFTLNLVSKQKKRALTFAALIFLSLLTLIYTGCRGAYIGIIAFFACCAGWAIHYITTRYGSFSNLKKRWKNTIIVASTGFLVFLFANPAILKRIFSIFAFREDSSISFRMNVYKSSWAMFLDNPIFGIGLGNQNFREIYGLYMLTGFDALGAYSVPLEIAVEMGLLGFASFFAILFIAFYRAVLFLRSDVPQTQEKLLIFSMLMLIALLMTHGLIDTIFYRPQVQMLFWFALAVININAQPCPISQPSSRSRQKKQ